MALDLVIENGTAEDGSGMPRHRTDVGVKDGKIIRGARRLVQATDGIAATIVNGSVAFEDGEPTGNHAGRVLKGRLAAGD